MGSCHVAEAGLKFLGSTDTPTLVFQSSTGVSHCTQVHFESPGLDMLMCLPTCFTPSMIDRKNFRTRSATSLAFWAIALILFRAPEGRGTEALWHLLL